MGTIALDRFGHLLDNTMGKLQDICLLATLLWLGWNIAGMSTIQGAINHSQSKSHSWSLTQSKINTLSSEYSISSLNKSDRSELFAQKSTPKSSGRSEPIPMAFKMLTIGLPATFVLLLIATPLRKRVFSLFKSNYEEKFDKLEVPEGSINLHSRSFKLTSCTSTDKLNDSRGIINL